MSLQDEIPGAARPCPPTPRTQKMLTEVHESTLKNTPLLVWLIFFLTSLLKDAVKFLWKSFFCTRELLKSESKQNGSD